MKSSKIISTGNIGSFLRTQRKFPEHGFQWKVGLTYNSQQKEQI